MSNYDRATASGYSTSQAQVYATLAVADELREIRKLLAYVPKHEVMNVDAQRVQEGREHLVEELRRRLNQAG